MACNAWNHPTDCSCGWGGAFYGGGNESHALKWPTQPGSFINPNARCPKCGTETFFFRSPSGGSVYFDGLGPPWPKHPCMIAEAISENPTSAYWSATEYLNKHIFKRIPIRVMSGTRANISTWWHEAVRSRIAANGFQPAVATWIVFLPPIALGTKDIDISKIKKSQAVSLAQSVLDSTSMKQQRHWVQLCKDIATAILEHDITTNDKTLPTPTLFLRNKND